MTIVELLVQDIARLAKRDRLTIVTAESLTCGSVAAALGSGPDAAVWFGGGVVAYPERVKYDVLGVDEGPVVTQQCAEQMAQGARRLLGGDVAIATTGVGGPGPSEGREAGTVFVAVSSGDHVETHELRIKGVPEMVLAKTREVALQLLREVVTRRGAGRTTVRLPRGAGRSLPAGQW
jgi:nicotinamide-nucleotide amidase